MKNKIYPCIWFDNQAKEAAEFYCSVFSNTVITAENHFVVTFESAGQRFMCLNGGPMFKPDSSTSFFVVFETIEEIDSAYKMLSENGTILMPLDKYDWSDKYVWLADKYGVNWQLSYGKMTDVGQKFSPTLMFTGTQHGRAEEALNFYTSVFPSSSVTGIMRYSADDHDIEGTVKHAQIRLNDYVFMVMDSSYDHNVQFSEGLSFVVECDTQEEIDYYWEKLTEGGNESMCGWLKDKLGVSWQIIPSILHDLMSDPSKMQRVSEAFMKMRKFDLAEILQAAEG